MSRLVGLLLLCLIMAACTKDGGDALNTSAVRTPASPVGTSASPAATRTGPLTTGPGVKSGETPPTLDTIGAQDTVEGAQNFAAYFYKALDWSFATTDSYLLKQLTASTCTPCQSYISTIDALAAQGGHIEGGRLLITGIAVTTGTITPADQVIRVNLVQLPGQALRPGQAPSVAASGDADATNNLYLSWAGGTWHVTDIG